MAALTQDRNTERREGHIVSLPVKGSTKIFGGSLVAIDASGYAVPASNTANLKVQGVAEGMADNSNGPDGDIRLDVRRGIYLFASSSLTIADVGKPLYVSDDQTVTKTATTNKVMAGILFDFESATKAWLMVPGIAGAVVSAVSTIDASDLTTEQALANANKVAVNALIAELKQAGVIAPV